MGLTQGQCRREVPTDLIGKYEEKRLLRSRNKWKSNIKMGLQLIVFSNVNRINLPQSRD
jgi:hypothetical protein